ncbi:MAG: signal peptidase I, partial [Dehalococcoidia bacterium]
IQPPSHWPPGQESARQELDDDDPWASFMAEQETEEPLPFGSPATVTPGAPVSWATSAPGPENDEHSAVRPAAAPAGGATRHAFVEGDAEQDAPLTRDLWARAFSAANSPAAARQPGPDEVAPPAAPLEPAPSGASDADADEPDAPLTRDLFARAFSAADRAGEVEQRAAEMDPPAAVLEPEPPAFEAEDSDDLDSPLTRDLWKRAFSAADRPGEVEQPAAEMDPPAAVLEPEPPAFEAEEGDDLDAPLTRDLWKRAFSAADGPGEVEQPAAEIDPPAAALEPEPPAFEAEEGDEFDAPLTRDLFARAFSAADRAEEVEQPDPDEAAPPLARPAWDPATLWARTSPNHGPSRAAANLPPPPAWEPEDDTASPAGPHRATDGYAVSRQWEDREPAPAAEVTTEDDPWAAIVAASGYDDRGPDAASVYLGKRPEAKSEELTAAPIVTRYPEPEPAAPEPAAWADEAPAPPAPALDIPRWAEAESDDDTLLRAFEAHASQAVEDDPEPADDAAMEAFEPLFGKLAAELVNETESIAISSRTQAASWTPPSARLTPSDSMAASSPFGPAAPPPGWSDAGRVGFDDTFPLPGAFAGFGEDELAVPAANANRGRTLIRELVETGLLALLVFLAVRASFQNFKVDGSSMFPTLKDGQFLIVNKLVYSEVDVDKMSRFLPFLDPGAEPKRHVFHAPDRGDIIVLIDPKKPDTDLIKRVVGLPGETVEIVDGRVYIDGFLLDEPYIKTPWHDNRPKVAIPEGQYFVMGDNRDNSLDSRSSQVGLIPKDLIIGKALLSYWPKAQFGPAPNGSPKITDTPLPSIAIPTEEPQKAAAGR